MNFSPTQPVASNEYFPAPNDNASGLKLRSRRPCDPCRRRKSRCEILDGNPPCSLCRFHGQECTFNDEPQPRKRRAVASNSDLSPINRSHASLALGAVHAADVPMSNIRQEPPIDDYANLKGPSLLKKTLGLQSHRHSRLIGMTSEFESLLLGLDQNPQKQETVLGQLVLRKVDDSDTTFLLCQDADTQNHRNDIPDLDAIESIVAPHGQALIHLYFRIVHPSFPVLHKKVFLEKYERTHREFSPPLLAAVYLLALNWWSYSTELALLPKPDVSRLEELALRSIGNIIHRPKLSTIQAGLLLLQRPEGDSWALTSQLVGLGQDLGLHLDCTTWRIPSWERGLRKRLAWAIFMQDKWGGLVHGRPSHITTSDWETQCLENDDFPENAADEDDEDGSTEVEKGRTLFCEMIKLTQILAQILAKFYTLKAEREFASRAHEGVRFILEKAKPLQLALRDWHSNLPAVLKMENIAARKLSSTGYLHLGYYAVELTLHRKIIRSLSSADDPALRSICRQAAQTRLRTVMDFVQNLRPEHLQSFWYSASKYNFALVGTFISLLWVTATETEEARIYQAKLDEYRWLLRLSSKSADFLESALSMLARSSGVLVKAIPTTPDPNLILNKYQQRAQKLVADSNSAMASAGPESSGFSSVVYQSEPEYNDDTSPENVLGETPSDSGLVGREWNLEHAWFNTLGNEQSGAFEIPAELNMSSAYGDLRGGQAELEY